MKFVCTYNAFSYMLGYFIFQLLTICLKIYPANMFLMAAIIILARYCIFMSLLFRSYFVEASASEGVKMEESYMTVKDFCDKLQISSSTVYRMIKDGMIPAIKFGRYWKIPRSVFGEIKTRAQ